MPLDEAALFGCAVLTGVGAVVNTAQVRVGASVAVIGLGGVGLAALIGAQAAGARQIVAVDLSDDKLRAGARAGRDPRRQRGARPMPLEQIRALSSGGVEFAFEFAGSIRALELAYRITRRGGTTVTAGLAAARRDVRRCRPSAWWPKSARSRAATSVPACRRATSRATSICIPQGRLPVDKLLTGRLTLDEINHGFDLLHEGKAIRQVVVFP